MIENVHFIKSKDNDLFCIESKNIDQVPSNIIIFCHAFAEEKLWSHRVVVNFCRKLAIGGNHVIRFDFYGHGDSHGDFSNSTIDSMKDNLGDIVKYAKNIYDQDTKVGIVGLRLGANIVIEYVEENKDIDWVVLWEPIVDGKKYIKELLRINMATQLAVHKKVVRDSRELIKGLERNETVNIDGYELTHILYKQIAEINLLKEKKYNSRVLLVFIDKLGKKINEKIMKYANTWKNGNAIEVKEDKFWKELKRYYFEAKNLYEATFRWIDTA